MNAGVLSSSTVAAMTYVKNRRTSIRACQGRFTWEVILGGASPPGSAPLLGAAGGRHTGSGSPFPAAEPRCSLTLCPPARGVWLLSKYGPFMLSKKARFNCWELGRQIGMYLGESILTQQNTRVLKRRKSVAFVI